MMDSVAAQADNRLAAFAGYCLGQLRALNADHRALLEFPGVQQQLSQREIRRGHSDGLMGIDQRVFDGL